MQIIGKRTGARFLILLAVFLAAITVGVNGARGQASAWVAATGEIPKENYKTWSLFLICNSEWLVPERGPDLYALYEQFQRFGRAIGDDHVAVWFWKQPRSGFDPRLADNVDLERSVRFCRTLQLKPSEGPYLLITQTYPEEGTIPEERAVFSLSGMKSSDISGLLTKLTDKLVLQGRVAPDDPDLVQRQGLWVRIMIGVQQALGQFGCAWRVQISTGLVNAELRSCEGS